MAAGYPRASEDAEAAADRRLLKWLRHQVNQDLRYWRHDTVELLGQETRERLALDCQAKRELLSWAESWCASVRGRPDEDPELHAVMVTHLKLVMAAVRMVARGYRGRPGWRPEWDLRGGRG